MELISIDEFCCRYRICRRTVWNWARSGRLRVLRDKGGRIFRLIDPQWCLLDEHVEADVVMSYGALKPGELASLLGVHSATIRKMVRQGRLKPVYAGSQRRFSLAEARRALAERMLGRKPTNQKEVSQMVVRWAAQRLGLSAPL